MPKRNGSVHVAKIVRRYKGRVYTAYLLRRTYRDGKHVRHQTLGNISHLPLALIGVIQRSLKGETFVSSQDAFEIQASLPHGHVEAVLGVIRKIGLDALIASKPCRERDLVMAMIAERLIHPCSKLSTTRLWHMTTLAEELGVGDADEDALYDAMDWLLSRQPRIEKRLAERHLSEGATVLYDVTSSGYHGRHCPIAQRGHNRDGERDLACVVYGVLTDAEGRPIGVDVYPGNTGDPTTVPDQVRKTRKRFHLDHVVLVGDRGMLTQAKIEVLKTYPGIGWISTLRTEDIRSLMEQASLQRSLFEQRNLAEISSPDFPSERLIACFNPLLLEERRRKRGELLEVTEAELRRIEKEVARRTKKPMTADEIGLKVGRQVHRFKMAKHFELAISEGKFAWKRIDESIRKEEALDGFYVIRTSEPKERLSAEDAVRTYKGLARVEGLFRCLKKVDLRVRPIRHHKENRVKAHIFLCVLAYYVEWHMRRALAPLLFQDEEIQEDRKTRDPVAPAEPSASARAKKADHRTTDGQFLVHDFEGLLRVLATRCRNRCRAKADPSATTFLQVTQPSPLQAQALQLLGVAV